MIVDGGRRNSHLDAGALTPDRSDPKTADAEQQLLYWQELASLGTAAARTAHEINNPNNTIGLLSSLMQDIWNAVTPILDEYLAEHGDFSVCGENYSDIRHEVPQYLDGIGEAIRKIADIAHSIGEFPRSQRSASIAQVDVNEVIQSAVESVDHVNDRSSGEWEIRYAENIPKISADAHGLQHAMVNLLRNAMEAARSPDQRIRVRTSYAKESRRVMVEIRDEGEGIARETLDRVMTPFFTTRRKLGGKGLGLAASYSIIKRQGGDLSITSEPGQGTTVTVSFCVTGIDLL